MAKKSNTEEFIKRAKEKHGDKYNYDKVNYINSTTKVTITCFIHGDFEQTPQCHLHGYGCTECAGTKQLTTETFIEKAKSVHGDKYDYSKVNYKNNYTKVTIICPEHGEFEQEPRMHLSGSGCPKCAHDSLKLTKEEFIKKSKEIHGDKYDYSKVNYVNTYTRVVIICPIHGEFEQRPQDHLEGRGCQKCSLIEASNKNRDTTDEFIEKARKVHGDRYDYSKVNYIDHKTPVTIVCPEHGEFEQIPSSHLLGYGCPVCSMSRLESRMRTFLIDHNICFYHRMKWPWLKLQHVDFYLPEYNVAIECQGLQHFESVKYFGGEKHFSETVTRDKKKQKLCEENGIKIIYFSNLSNSSRKYDYPYKVYEDEFELFRTELNLEIN